MNNKGFTLLEVTLFLAISGALGLIAFLGLGPRLRNVRFTQSVRLIENTINAQFKSSTSGENVRPAKFTCTTGGPFGTLSIGQPAGGATNPTGSSANCVINGKMVFFEGDKMTFYSIISRRVGTRSDCPTASTLTDIETCYMPQLTGVDQNEPPDAVGVAYSSGVNATFPASPTNYRGYGYIQSPNGVQHYPFFFTQTSVQSAQKYLQGSTTTPSGSLAMCLELSGRRATLTVAENDIKPKISFEGCTP